MNKRKWVIVACAIIGVILYTQNNLTKDNISILAWVGFGALFLGSLENEMRYGSPQLISYTVRGSADLEAMVKLSSGWCAVPLGTIKHEGWGVFQKGGQGTIVFKSYIGGIMGGNGGSTPLPATTDEPDTTGDTQSATTPTATGNAPARSGNDGVLVRIGDGSAVLLASPIPCDEYELDPELRDAIVGRRGFKPPYYKADIPINPVFFGTRTDIDVNKMVAEYNMLRRQINSTKDALRAKYGMIDREVGRITGAWNRMNIRMWEQWFRRSATPEKPPSES